MNDLESNDESVNTPLVSPFPHSYNDSDDGEVLNELIEYANVGMLRREKAINSFNRDDLAFQCMIGFRKSVAYFDPFLSMNIITCKAYNTIMVEGLERDSKTFDTLADLRSCVNIIPLYLFKKLNIGLLEETDYVFGLANGTKSYPVGIVRDVEVHIGRLKLLNNFYVIDMKKDLETPLLVGSGFLATANAVIDCRKAKIAVGEMITRNMWESEDLIENLINWDKPPKNRDRAWHAKIRLIDPDREEFTKTLQSFPTSRKLSERESPKEIINLDHIYDRK
ncbi:MAK10-like protein [Tanacetum coccineum]